jgi:adenosylhomocysteine nucleosidase
MATIGLICAVPQESSSLVRRFPAGKNSLLKGMKTRLFTVGPHLITLIESGIGKDNSRRGTLALIEESKPDMIISFGFCGALTTNLSVGDLVAAEAIHFLSGSGSLSTGPLPLMVITPPSPGRCFPGNFITASQAFTKENVLPIIPAGMNHPVLEMESAFVGDICREAGVHFAAIRAVSDSAAEEPYHTFTAIAANDFSITPRSITIALLKNPGLIPSLLRLARNARVAARSLADSLDLIIKETR